MARASAISFSAEKCVPEERDAVGAVGAGERALQALDIVDVGRDDLGAERGEGAGLVGLDVAGEGAGREGTGFVAQDGAHQSAALGAGGADHGDDLLLGHCDSSVTAVFVGDASSDEDRTLGTGAWGRQGPTCEASSAYIRGSMPEAPDHLAGLNSAQRAAAEYGTRGLPHELPGPLLIVAGAGTGKTNTLAHRVAHLIVAGPTRGRILLLTFTRRAAAGDDPSRAAHRARMRRRVAQRLQWAGTFHAIANRLLRLHAASVGLDAGVHRARPRRRRGSAESAARRAGALASSDAVPAEGHLPRDLLARGQRAAQPLEATLASGVPVVRAVGRRSCAALFARLRRGQAARTTSSTTTTCCSTGTS